MSGWCWREPGGARGRGVVSWTTSNGTHSCLDNTDHALLQKSLETELELPGFIGVHSSLRLRPQSSSRARATKPWVGKWEASRFAVLILHSDSALQVKKAQFLHRQAERQVLLLHKRVVEFHPRSIQQRSGQSSMAAMKAYSISVPTKQGDETTTTTTRHIVGESQHEQDDAFSRYSNDFVRMKSLLLSSEEE
eukprot:scaffold28924_cov122-Skeletonema_dohrnii-CCMP3373.AAC.1